MTYNEFRSTMFKAIRNKDYYLVGKMCVDHPGLAQEFFYFNEGDICG